METSFKVDLDLDLTSDQKRLVEKYLRFFEILKHAKKIDHVPQDLSKSIEENTYNDHDGHLLVSKDRIFLLAMERDKNICYFDSQRRGSTFYQSEGFGSNVIIDGLFLLLASKPFKQKINIERSWVPFGGCNTRRALNSIQKSTGITPDEIIGPSTNLSGRNRIIVELGETVLYICPIINLLDDNPDMEVFGTGEACSKSCKCRNIGLEDGS